MRLATHRSLQELSAETEPKPKCRDSCFWCYFLTSLQPKSHVKAESTASTASANAIRTITIDQASENEGIELRDLSSQNLQPEPRSLSPTHSRAITSQWPNLPTPPAQAHTKSNSKKPAWTPQALYLQQMKPTLTATSNPPPQQPIPTSTPPTQQQTWTPNKTQPHHNTLQ